MPGPVYGVLVVFALVITGLELAFSSEIRALTSLFYLLGILVWFRYGAALRTSLPTSLLLGAISVAVISWLAMRLQHPEMAHASLRAEGVLNKFVFLIFAFLLAGSVRNVFIFWAIAFLAVLTYPWTNGGGWSEVTRLFSGYRVGMGTNPLRAGLIWGTVFLGLCCFSHRLVFRPSFSWLRFLLWLAVTLSALAIALATQVRAVYLGLAIVAVVALIVVVVRSRTLASSLRARQARQALLGAAALIVIAVVFSVQSPFMERTMERTQNEMDVIQQIASGDLEGLPRSSIGLRIYFWQDAMQWISERPLTGWDYRASRVLHEQAGNMHGPRYFHTIHNDYIDIVLSFGLLGGLLFAALFGWLSIGSYRAWKAGLMPTDFAVFFGCFAVFFSVNSMFMSLLFVHDSIYLFNIMMAGFATFILKHRVEEGSRFKGVKRFFV